MKKTFVLLLIILLGIVVYAEDYKTVQINYADTDSLDYDNYIKDPSKTIFNNEQEIYIYDNYGSSASMEYLNRGDADSYSGGSDFDRNY